MGSKIGERERERERESVSPYLCLYGFGGAPGGLGLWKAKRNIEDIWLESAVVSRNVYYVRRHPFWDRSGSGMCMYVSYMYIHI